MASITIRNLPDQIKESLRVKAAKHGVSLEAYLRTILQQASKPDNGKPVNILDLAQKYFGSENGVDLDLPERSSHRKPVSFD